MPLSWHEAPWTSLCAHSLNLKPIMSTTLHRNTRVVKVALSRRTGFARHDRVLIMLSLGVADDGEWDFPILNVLTICALYMLCV